MNDNLADVHSIAGSVVRHLLPGVAILAVYLLVAVPLAGALDLPRQLAVVIKSGLGTTAILLGVLLYLGVKRNGRVSLIGIVLYRNRVPSGQLLLIVLALYLWAVAVIKVLEPVDDALVRYAFHWLPETFFSENDLSGYSAPALWSSYIASLVVVGVAAPIAEELYFRGYLLPRMSRMGRWAPLWNAVLFNAYHFWSPWRLISRSVFTLPMVYAVWKKRSISIGIWWHCLGNVTGEILSIVAIARASRELGG